MIVLRKNLKLKDNITLLLRNGENRDVSAVTKLIQDSFSIWKQQSLSLSPMYQTEDDTKKYLTDSGFVVERSSEIIATFAIGEIYIETMSNGLLKLNEFENIREVPLIFKQNIRGGQFLKIKKIAVKKEIQRLGLGNLLLSEAEQIADKSKHAGVVLETVREATWLYSWYLKAGFKDIAQYKYPSSELETVLMIKEL